MIVDCYTHTWDSPAQLGRLDVSSGAALRVPPVTARRDTITNAGPERHLAACQPVDTTFVLGFKSRFLDAEIPNVSVADYVRRHPDRLVGFAGIDPTDVAAAIDEMHWAQAEPGMRGLALAPAAQDMHPCDSRTEIIYERAEASGLPVLIHPGIHISSECRLEYAQPVLLDEVARTHPDLRIIIAHMGYPWLTETLVLLAKHAHVYAEISWLLHQPWQAYQALLTAYQYGVMDKLLFGSGFPYLSATEGIEALYSINHLCGGTNLPRIPRESLRGIVQRDALTLLGIGKSTAPRDDRADTNLLDEDDD